MRDDIESILRISKWINAAQNFVNVSRELTYKDLETIQKVIDVMKLMQSNKQ